MSRIGLLTDAAVLGFFDAELVRKIHAAQIAEVVLVIEQDLPRKSLLDRVFNALKKGRLIRAVAFRLAVWIERRTIAILKPEINDLFRTIPVDQVCGVERLPVSPIVSPSGYVHRFAAADVVWVPAILGRDFRIF